MYLISLYISTHRLLLISLTILVLLILLHGTTYVGRQLISLFYDVYCAYLFDWYLVLSPTTYLYFFHCSGIEVNPSLGTVYFIPYRYFALACIYIRCIGINREEQP
jgi:hypothetical protein